MMMMKSRADLDNLSFSSVFYLQPSRHRRSNTYLRRQSLILVLVLTHAISFPDFISLSPSPSPCKVYPQIISGNTNQSQSSEQTSGGGGGVHAHFQSSKFLSLFLLGSSRFNWLNPVTKATQRLATAKLQLQQCPINDIGALTFSH